MGLQSYKELHVWNRARGLVREIYRVTASFPKEEIYGLTSQIKRATLSVSLNLAEGSARKSTRDFIRFISISYGSLAEVEAALFHAVDLGFLAEQEHVLLSNEINEMGRMLNGLEAALTKKLTTDH